MGKEVLGGKDLLERVGGEFAKRGYGNCFARNQLCTERDDSGKGSF